MLPPMKNGLLPPGIHSATWEEVRDCFGFTPHRRRLLIGAYRALLDLAEAGCQRAWLDGGFVTGKERPSDFDMAWDPTGVTGSFLHPALRDVAPPRHAQQARYGGDVVPNVVEGNSGMPFLDFFQQDRHTGQQRGIVELDLGGGL